MLARFIGGPHDGLELDRAEIAGCCTLQGFHSPSGLLVFALMPPTREDWQRIASGEAGKDEITGQFVPYYQVRTPSGVEFHFDEGGRRLAEVAAHPCSADEPPEPTGIYYKCLHGDNENLGLTEPFSFVVQDTNGKDWICYPVSREDVETLSLLDHVVDVMQADAKLKEHGLSNHGTETRVYFCQDVSELQEKLAKQPEKS